MFDSSATAVISTCEFDNKILKTFIESSNGFLEGISNNKYPFMRRQDLPKVYMSNGSIYIIDTKTIKNVNSFMTDKTLNYLMPKKGSVDIDSSDDLIQVEKILNP